MIDKRTVKGVFMVKKAGVRKENVSLGKKHMCEGGERADAVTDKQTNKQTDEETHTIRGTGNTQ